MPAEKDNLKPLKILVISLGFILLGGIVLLVAGLVQKFKSMDTSKICANQTITLQDDETITMMDTSENELRLLVNNSKGETAIVIVDRCEGSITQRLRIEN
jgi:hypothetical protein